MNEAMRSGDAARAYRIIADHSFSPGGVDYPVLSPPSVPGGAEPALVLSITRQESQFDPTVRSSADARGMMQILPSTGRLVARKIGIPWSSDVLWDANANMRLGSAYLGDLVDQFDGSYLLAMAGYNAGPGRPRQWVAFCGDPRSPGVDSLDFIECIPFSKTRNYVMNVMSNVQVHRARLNGGRAPVTAESELLRGRSPYARAAATSSMPSRCLNIRVATATGSDAADPHRVFVVGRISMITSPGSSSVTCGRQKP